MKGYLIGLLYGSFNAIITKASEGVNDEMFYSVHQRKRNGRDQQMLTQGQNFPLLGQSHEVQSVYYYI